mmetsp:Transcript_26949/g.47558  ORF Transcript_26949/g.47558 Transcript_26949/m.47558 type:complete len:128 (-) Transcript_26949:36-419(-)
MTWYDIYGFALKRKRMLHESTAIGYAIACQVATKRKTQIVRDAAVLESIAKIETGVQVQCSSTYIELNCTCTAPNLYHSGLGSTAGDFVWCCFFLVLFCVLYSMVSLSGPTVVVSIQSCGNLGWTST